MAELSQRKHPFKNAARVGANEDTHPERRSLTMRPSFLLLSRTAGAFALVSGIALTAAVSQAAEPVTPEHFAVLKSISRDATDLPGPIVWDHPATVRVELEAIEREAPLADGTVFRYWTFNGKVPGPFVRARVGDTIEVTLKNDKDDWMPHSVDFHAVTGPGGGAVATRTAPGGQTGFSFKALKPGLFVYHCATPMVADHIQAGMVGLIVVGDPAANLTKASKKKLPGKAGRNMADLFGKIERSVAAK